MGSEQFPMFRLATLLARQLSAPLAHRIKGFASSHPVTRRVVIAGAGRVFRRAELRYRLWALRLPAPARAPPLSDAEAVSAGADIIGELIIFSLGAAIIIFEVNRQADKQEIKAMEERSQWAAIVLALGELQQELQLQQQDIERLWAALRRLTDVPHQPSIPATPAPPAVALQSSPGEDEDKCNR